MSSSQCPRCGKPYAGAVTFCVGCGASLRQRPPSMAARVPQGPPMGRMVARGAGSNPAMLPSPGPRASLGPALPAPPVVLAPQPPPPPIAPPPQEGPCLQIEDLDGGAVGILPLNLGENVLGRNAAPMLAGDALLSGRHATIFVQGKLAMVRDEGSRNGVFVRLPKGGSQALVDGDQFLAGRVLLRWDEKNTGPLPGEEGPAPLPEALTLGQLALVLGRDVDPTLFPAPIPRAGITLGRKRGDLKFPSDPWISGEHCRLGLENEVPTLTDLESANGTWFRIRGPITVSHKDSLILGRRVFHLCLPASG